MRDRNGHRWLKWVVGLVLTTAMWACADDKNDVGNYNDTLQLIPYGRTFTDQGLVTRAEAGVPDGYVSFDVLYPDAMAEPVSFGIYMTPSEASTLRRVFSTETGGWLSYLRVKQAQQYYLYGFIPADAPTSSMVTYIDGDFKNGANLFLNGLDCVTTDDVCVIVGVQDADRADAPLDMRLGTFSYVGKQKGHNYAGLLVDHLYSSVTVTISVDENYLKLRTIKLKQLKFFIDAHSKMNAHVVLEPNTTGANPITSLTWDYVSGDEQEAVLFENAEGMALTSTPYALIGFFSPLVSQQLKVESSYDVYDKQGNLVRANCTVVNTLGNKVPFLLNGHKAEVNLKVNPTYLYQMSESDLNNPTIVIE